MKQQAPWHEGAEGARCSKAGCRNDSRSPASQCAFHLAANGTLVPAVLSSADPFLLQRELFDALGHGFQRDMLCFCWLCADGGEEEEGCPVYAVFRQPGQLSRGDDSSASLAPGAFLACEECESLMCPRHEGQCLCAEDAEEGEREAEETVEKGTEEKEKGGSKGGGCKEQDQGGKD